MFLLWFYVFSPLSPCSCLFGFESPWTWKQTMKIPNLKSHREVHLPQILVLQTHCPLLFQFKEPLLFLCLIVCPVFWTSWQPQYHFLKFSEMLASWFSDGFLVLLQKIFLRDFILIFALQFPKFCYTPNNL